MPESKQEVMKVVSLVKKKKKKKKICQVYPLALLHLSHFVRIKHGVTDEMQWKLLIYTCIA